MTDVNLHDTTDARVWADEFCKNWPTALSQIPGREGVETEEDFNDIMVVWFANAIMAGVDSVSASSPPAVTVKPLEWDGVTADAGAGCYYQSLVSKSGKSFAVSFVFRDGRRTIGYAKSKKESVELANTHNRDRILSQINITPAPVAGNTDQNVMSELMDEAFNHQPATEGPDAVQGAARVNVPVGLVPELQQWSEDELETCVDGTMHQKHLGEFYAALRALEGGE